MRYMKWIGLAAAVLLIASCFTPWVYIASRNITVSGIDATGTTFGKPGYFHFLCAFFFLLFHFIPRIWAKRSNLLVAALNTAWALRNFFMIAACYGGECPERKIGLYLVLLSSLLMLASTFFPDMKMTADKKENK
ncbi:MAG: hypothetical protein KA290_13600 [Chitinophagaceae bacterium]|nr:hypothetical protein [Chitinophagaceae bacterium]